MFESGVRVSNGKFTLGTIQRHNGLIKGQGITDLCELDADWVSGDRAVDASVPGIRDQLWIPDPEIVLAVRSLREYRDRRPEAARTPPSLGHFSPR